jgi:signal transduction histidine kinase
MATHSPGALTWIATRFAFWREFALSSAFLVTSFLLGTIWYLVLATILTLGEKLLIVGIGIPLLFTSPLIVKTAASIERRRLGLFLGITVKAAYQTPSAKGLWHRVFLLISDPVIWRDWIYVLLLFPLGALDAAVFLLGFCLPFALLLLPLFSQGIPVLTMLHFRNVDSWPQALLILPAGIIWLWGGFHLITWAARWHGICAQKLLGIPFSVRLAAVKQSRTQVLTAALDERQRIAQDLHDGVQQHLLALALNLGLAREKLETEPEVVPALIVKAHDQAKQSLADMRDLVRGIYPAILTDRGLDAALSALASHSSVPVTVTVTLKHRLPELIEATAYFIIAEALTNVAKHSGASHASITLAYEKGALTIQVEDDGHGGAGMIPGTGLSGLQNRLEALDGTLTIESPSGGPTFVRGVLPCA